MATSSPDKIIQNRHLKQLQAEHPNFDFVDSDSFYWSPSKQTVHYSIKDLDTPNGLCALIHETAHGALGHSSYTYDYELVKMELDAWVKAKEIAKNLSIMIDENHIEDCMDTYRDWLHGRSTCPICSELVYKYN